MLYQLFCVVVVVAPQLVRLAILIPALLSMMMLERPLILATII
jgi:hypothetical protein